MTNPAGLLAAADAWAVDLATIDDLTARLVAADARIAELEAAQAPPALWRGVWPWAGQLRNRIGNVTADADGRIQVRYDVDAADNDGWTGYGVMVRSRLAEDFGVEPADDLTVSYRLWVPANWAPYEGGKLPGLGGRGSLDTGSIPGGGNTTELGRAFSVRLMWKKPADGNLDHTRLYTYLYVVAANGGPMPVNPSNGRPYGVMVEFRGPGTTLHLRRGSWNDIITRVRMNTPGQADGIFQGWLNGVLGVDLHDVVYRDVDHPGLLVDTLMFETFYGGPTSNKTVQTAEFADVTITGA